MPYSQSPKDGFHRGFAAYSVFRERAGWVRPGPSHPTDEDLSVGTPEKPCPCYKAPLLNAHEGVDGLWFRGCRIMSRNAATGARPSSL